MSPWLHNHLTIFLFPDRIEIAPLRGQTDEHEIIPVAQQSEAPQWKSLLETLLHVASEGKFRRKRIVLVISNVFVRFAMLPWSPSLIKPDDELRLARICFEKTYGKMEDWRISIDAAKYGHPRLATAIPEDLVVSIESTFKKHRLISVQSFLAYTFNRYRGELTESDFVLGMPDTGKVCFASIQQRHWLGARNVSCNTFSDHEILAKNEILIRGLDPDSRTYWSRDLTGKPGKHRAKMSSLDMDYRKNATSRKAFLAIVLSMELLTGGYFVDRYRNLENKIHALKSGVAQKNNLNHEASLPASNENPEALKTELTMAENAIYSLSTPWGKLFDLIEHSLGKDVALLSIEPDAEAKSISVMAESKDYPSMMQYAKRLRNDPLVSDVHLINHQAQTTDPQKPIRFSLSVKLNQSSF